MQQIGMYYMITNSGKHSEERKQVCAREKKGQFNRCAEGIIFLSRHRP